MWLEIESVMACLGVWCGERTRSAVQVGEVEDVGCAADGAAGGAERELALDEGGSCESNGGEGSDGGDGELHVEGWLVVLKEEDGDCWKSVVKVVEDDC